MNLVPIQYTEEAGPLPQFAIVFWDDRIPVPWGWIELDMGYQHLDLDTPMTKFANVAPVK